MEERSKTNIEIYDQKYPVEELVEDPMLCAEAMGYLKALEEYLPSEQKWIEKEKQALMMVLLWGTIRGC